jgi:hypothetical protein
MFPNTILEDITYKWYKVYEEKGETWKWKTLKGIFIKDFSFFHSR